MSELLTLFINNLLPIFLISGMGYLLGRWLKISPRTFSQPFFYFFSPCLVFNSLIHTQLSSDAILRMMFFALSITAIIGLITWFVGLTMHLERSILAAVMLTSMFNNAGNLGLPVNLFAFGETALAYATLYFVTVSTLNNTVGVVIASLGSTNIKQAVLGLFKVPALYSISLAFIIINQGWHLPLFLERSVGLAANAAIPLMLVLLGLQFQNIRWAGHVLPLGVTNIIRLLVSPVIALVLSPVFGLAGVSRQAGILESAMPAAVLTTVIATEFNIEPAFVTAAVFTSTLLSPLTLTPLLAYLK